MNDNSPAFAVANLPAISKSETTAVGTLLATVAATDGDSDNTLTDHSVLIYQICNSLEAEGIVKRFIKFIKTFIFH